jgi:hypothetical protein
VLKFETFVKLMMMTTSTSDGEALTAIRKANTLLKAEGKNWEELITGLVPMEPDRPPREEPSPRRRPRTETPPWADDQEEDDWKAHVPHRHSPEYQTFIFGAFEEALAKVRKGSSFRNTLESIHQWWQDKHFLTDAQLRVVLKAAGRIPQ